jgi:hypothetical protein
MRYGAGRRPTARGWHAQRAGPPQGAAPTLIRPESQVSAAPGDPLGRLSVGPTALTAARRGPDLEALEKTMESERQIRVAAAAAVIHCQSSMGRSTSACLRQPSPLRRKPSGWYDPACLQDRLY